MRIFFCADKVFSLLDDPSPGAKKSDEALRRASGYTIDRACDAIELVYGNYSK